MNKVCYSERGLIVSTISSARWPMRTLYSTANHYLVDFDFPWWSAVNRRDNTFYLH